MSAYHPKEIEQKWYRYWEENNFFRTEINPNKTPHVIVMPPPNVTGKLHMGHALQDTVQDVLTRIKRMQGYEALWLPGMDHAGIATQNVVEKEIKKTEGKDRHAYGREKFVEKVWAWKEEYGGMILKQKRLLGDSCDWSRERFTLDDGFYKAVMEVFVKLYNDGLIYRGEYIINWCPVDLTALSDEEVDNVETDSFLWYLRYNITGTDESIVIATQRPETIFGDMAIAVHPEDERYTNLIGKTVTVPLTDRQIPIIADEYVEKDFGSGALKITPNHDKNDFEVAKRHGLAFRETLNPNATLNENTPYNGMDRFEARKKVSKDLEAAGFLEKTEAYKTMIPISSRSKAVVEPRVSLQWFVKMKPLADRALHAWRDGELVFHPRRWENDYDRWLSNIRDWCISRQLWWGHRIPAWYWTNEDGTRDESRGFLVSVEQPEAGMIQDEDVLDTWFSSWLWPFGTLGWPQKTPELDYFYPGAVLVSGYDILFFWVARMIMGGLYCMDKVPYKDVYLTPLIRDKHGKKMSKSAGNGIDPMDLIEEYGADAVRFSLTALCALGQDMKLDPEMMTMGRNFANKIWNSFKVFGRFIEEGKDYRQVDTSAQSLADQWMLHRINETLELVNADIKAYRLNEALLKIYDLFWSDFCDWYLEVIKPPFGEAMPEEKVALAAEVYERLLKLLHPFMPFITEELWAQLRPRAEKEAIIVADWLEVNESEKNATAARQFRIIQEMISGIRNIKAKMNIPPSKTVTALVNVLEADAEMKAVLEANEYYFRKLAKVDAFTVEVNLAKPQGSAAIIVEGHQVFIPLADLIDLDVERQRLTDAIAQKEGFLKSVQGKLNNEGFVARAPANVVEMERKKAQDAMLEIEKLRENLESLT
jgi:valyl-tRNA synthetase